LTSPGINFPSLLFAIFAYWLVFIIGVPGVRPVVGEITPNSIAASAQIAPGMELKAVDGIETPDWDAVRLQLVDKIGGEQTTVSVAPFGSDSRQQKTLDLRNWAFEPDKQDPVASLGIQPRGAQIESVLAEVPQHADRELHQLPGFTRGFDNSIKRPILAYCLILVRQRDNLWHDARKPFILVATRFCIWYQR